MVSPDNEKKSEEKDNENLFSSATTRFCRKLLSSIANEPEASRELLSTEPEYEQSQESLFENNDEEVPGSSSAQHHQNISPPSSDTESDENGLFSCKTMRSMLNRCSQFCCAWNLQEAKSYVFHSEDDANIRFSDGKAYITHRPMNWLLVSKSSPYSCQSKDNVISSETKTRRKMIIPIPISTNTSNKSLNTGLQSILNSSKSADTVENTAPVATAEVKDLTVANEEIKNITSAIKEVEDITSTTEEVEDINSAAEEAKVLNFSFKTEKNKQDILLDEEKKESIELEDSNDIKAHLLSQENISFQLSPKKKSSILTNVPKMETIPENERFSSFTTNTKNEPLKVTFRDASQVQVHELNDERKIKSTTEFRDEDLDLVRMNESNLLSTPRQSPPIMKFDEAIIWDRKLSENDEQYLEALNMVHEPTKNIWLAYIGDAKGIQEAISNGETLDELDHIDRSLLHLAAQSGSHKTVKLLLDAGLDPNMTDAWNQTPLFYATMRAPCYAIAKLLFERGAKIPPKKNRSQLGLFMHLLTMCRPTEEEKKIIKLFMRNGAQLEDPRAPGGRQALHYAAMGNNSHLIRVLADIGADINAVNNQGMTPLDVAKFYRCRDAQFCLEDIAIEQMINKQTEFDFSEPTDAYEVSDDA